MALFGNFRGVVLTGASLFLTRQSGFGRKKLGLYGFVLALFCEGERGLAEVRSMEGIRFLRPGVEGICILKSLIFSSSILKGMLRFWSPICAARF
jgi:hypothetical protein